MKNINENLSTILDIQPINETPQTNIVATNQEVDEEPQHNTVVDADTEYARTNLKSLIEKGNTALDQLLILAKEAETARAYEVIAGLMKSVAEMNKDLLEIQKRKKELSPKDYGKQQNINVDKAVVFTGSTAELIKLIKQQNKEDV
jgi:hypothetical protein